MNQQTQQTNPTSIQQINDTKENNSIFKRS